MTTDSFVILNNKFISDLEEILQCPVCYETLSKVIPTCILGHHVCMKCHEQMSNCPFCKGQFNGTRNFLAENLLAKFEDIKSSLINPRQKVSKEIQTDFDELDNQWIIKVLIKKDMTRNVKKNYINTIATPTAGKGTFPCKFENCNAELPYCRMFTHVLYNHKEYLIEEKAMQNLKYILEWEFDNSIKNYERFIRIPNMGLFYLQMTITDTGDLKGNVQIIHNAATAKQFKYCLTVGNRNTNVGYNAHVMSCRTVPEKIKMKCFYINSLFLSQLIGEKKNVSCTLILYRVMDSKLQQEVR